MAGLDGRQSAVVVAGLGAVTIPITYDAVLTEERFNLAQALGRKRTVDASLAGEWCGAAGTPEGTRRVGTYR
jgi:hypothetical protein